MHHSLRASPHRRRGAVSNREARPILSAISRTSTKAHSRPIAPDPSIGRAAQLARRLPRRDLLLGILSHLAHRRLAIQRPPHGAGHPHLAGTIARSASDPAPPLALRRFSADFKYPRNPSHQPLSLLSPLRRHPVSPQTKNPPHPRIRGHSGPIVSYLNKRRTNTTMGRATYSDTIAQSSRNRIALHNYFFTGAIESFATLATRNFTT